MTNPSNASNASEGRVSAVFAICARRSSRARRLALRDSGWQQPTDAFDAFDAFRCAPKRFLRGICWPGCLKVSI
jgi:hypothetical protein